MPTLLHPSSKSFNLLHSSLTLNGIMISPKCAVAKYPNSNSFIATGSHRTLIFLKNSMNLRSTHLCSCSRNDVFEESTDTHLSKKPKTEEIEELGLLGKPLPKPVNGGSPTESEEETRGREPRDSEAALEPFYNLFRPKESEASSDESSIVEEEQKTISVEYYDPKPGDFAVGVVVSGSENKLDVYVGADLLGTMLTKEVLPLYNREMDYLSCDMEKQAEEFMVSGKMGILSYEEAVGGEPLSRRPVVEPGTVLFAEVLGRTLGGRPLLSTRRFFRRIAWHRVRQIKQLNVPIEVKITEWNTGGLLTRIEGIRAFLPKVELIKKVNNFTELKANVGRRLYVLITRLNEDTNDLILSEKEAWEMEHLQEGKLLEGTVRKIYPYGAQIRIAKTNRSGLLHISNITCGRVASVGDLLAVGEKVKVLVVKSMFPEKIFLSIADLESEPGLFTSNRERVFSEAEEMAKKYRRKLRYSSPTCAIEPLLSEIPFEDEERLYANWKWFKFERENVPKMTPSPKEEGEEE